MQIGQPTLTETTFARLSFAKMTSDLKINELACDIVTGVNLNTPRVLVKGTVKIRGLAHQNPSPIVASPAPDQPALNDGEQARMMPSQSHDTENAFCIFGEAREVTNDANHEGIHHSDGRSAGHPG